MSLLSQKSANHNVKVVVKANSDAEAVSKAQALSKISSISLKNLKWLAQASQKQGIENKLELAKKFV